MAILPSQRSLFDIPEHVAYFNCAYNSPQLNESRRRLLEGVESKSRPWERMTDDFFLHAELIRKQGAAIFGGDADGYAIVPAASYAFRHWGLRSLLRHSVAHTYSVPCCRQAIATIWCRR